MNRIANVERNTLETNIKIELDIDGNGLLKGKTGIGFFDHMLNLLAKHGNFNLQIYTKGDTYVDNHHLIEDIGIVLGECLVKALGNKAGINRYGSFTCPMDETLTTVDLDLSGRGYLVYNVKLNRDMIGEFETEMLKEFLYALAINGRFNLHINNHYGENDHHKIESIFKAMGRALRIACKIEDGNMDIPSTKGVI
ncbi:imidazoleglycerol-phosphate dehydratase HisB [Miniphocaeibacter halophilus]|uniref:Imidazoleglycerol-phosphate dehydratase HisB n=1 Tax=Miniphocaeibacter halophilus TaxID=2931922 RepID=A0AC61MQE7_9FIRM|nr:imidazoleglycerol-phosphate dehydratase HisB [Miniphocaeibacter halophilus]QQK07825.1 imidazoleglycerol-phosphate dehydratase HisB [Miniphocaeibacter halophilus]